MAPNVGPLKLVPLPSPSPSFPVSPLMSWDLGSRGHGGLAACRGGELGKLAANGQMEKDRPEENGVTA